MRARRTLAAVAGLLIGLLATAAIAHGDPIGTVSVFAPVGEPWFPALPHLVGDRIYEGTYSNPAGDSEPSKVFEYLPDGTLVQTFTVTGQDLSQPHGVQVAANDAQGRLLLLDRTSGRIIRLDPRTGAQTLYARIPDLPTCTTAPGGTPCSPALVDQPPMPDYAAWGPDGSLYVTDYQQAVIWRIPQGGGTPSIWLADRRLDGGPFGTACIVLEPDHHTLLFDQASHGGLGATSPATGSLYEVAIEPGGNPGPLREIWSSGQADAPDGCALSSSGHVYMALVGGSDQVVELSATGQELTRFGQQYTGADGSPVPFDSPSGVAFLGSDLLIANQSYAADDHANQVILRLQTGEAGAPVYVPPGAGSTPARRTSPRAHRRRHRHRHHHRHRHRHHRHHWRATAQRRPRRRPARRS